jgi:hypothetical protein
MTITPTDATTATARTAVDEELSTRRLNIMRFGYAFMGVGLVIVKWPLLIQDAASVPLMDPSPVDRRDYGAYIASRAVNELALEYAPVSTEQTRSRHPATGYRNPHFRGNVYPIWRRMSCSTPMIQRSTGKLGSGR